MLLNSCGKEPSQQSKPLAKVNNYVIEENNFRRELAASAYFHDIKGLSYEDKRKFLDSRIRKEILIQQATKLGLDREETFRQAIERYWEQTLISSLLQRKSAELEKEVIVTSDEVEKRYLEMKKTEAKLPPLAEMKEELAREIREEKKTSALEAWMKGLQDRAEVVVYEDNLRALQ